MDKIWQKNIPADFPSDAHVWIYQSDQPLSEELTTTLQEKIDKFLTKWKSHSNWVKGWGSVLFDQFIVFMADDRTDPICGNAVDRSVRFIKKIEREHDLRFLDRMKMAFLVQDRIEIVPFGEVGDKMEQGELLPETLFFNNAIRTKEELLQEWIVPIKESFLWERVVAD